MYSLSDLGRWNPSNPSNPANPSMTWDQVSALGNQVRQMHGISDQAANVPPAGVTPDAVYQWLSMLSARGGAGRMMRRGATPAVPAMPGAPGGGATPAIPAIPPKR